MTLKTLQENQERFILFKIAGSKTWPNPQRLICKEKYETEQKQLKLPETKERKKKKTKQVIDRL